MAKIGSDDAAAQAAAAAAARQRAEEAARARARAAAQAAAAQQAAAKAATKTATPTVRFENEMSTGQGSALRVRATNQLASSIPPSVGQTSTVSAPRTPDVVQRQLDGVNALLQQSGLPPSMRGDLLKSKASLTTELQTPPASTPLASTTTTADTATPEQAKADVDALRQVNGDLDPNDVAGLIAAHPANPAYAAAAAAEAFQQDSSVLSAFNPDLHTDPGVQKTLAAAISLAQANGSIPADIAQQVSSSWRPDIGDNLAQNLAAVKGQETAALTAGAASPAAKVDAAAALTHLVDKAKGGVAEAEQELGRLASTMGPLSNDQRKAFVAQFEKDHPEFAAYQAAQAQLASYVSANQSDLTAAVKADPNAATTVAAAYKDLVGSDEENKLGLTGQDYGSLVAAGLHDPDVIKALAAADPDFANVTAPAAAQSVFKQLETGNAPEAVFGELQDLVTAYGRSGVPGIADGANSLAQSMPKFQEAFEKLHSTRPLDQGAWDQFKSDWKEASGDAGETTMLGKVFAGAGFAIGVVEIGEGAAKGNRDEMMRGLVDSAANSAAVGYGMEVAGKWLGSIPLELAGKGAADALEKFGGVIGSFAGAVTWVQDMGHLDKGSDQTKAWADGLSTIGGALLLVPGAEGFGVALSVAGAGLSIYSGLQAQGEQSDLDKKYDGEASQIYDQLGALPSSDPGHVDPNLGKTLLQLDPASIDAITRQYGLGYADWVKMAKAGPDALARLGDLVQNNPEQVARLTALGLSGPRLMEMAAANPVLSNLMSNDGTLAQGVATMQRVVGGSPDQLEAKLIAMANASPEQLDSVLSDLSVAARNVSTDPAKIRAWLIDNGTHDAGYAAVVNAMLS